MLRRAGVITALLLLCVPALGQALRLSTLRGGQRELSWQVGYGESQHIPSTMRNHFGVDLLKVRYGRYASPTTEWAGELAIGRQTGGLDNYALSGIASYRHLFLVRGRAAVGFDIGVGLVQFRDMVKELGSRFNFTEQIGACFLFTTGPSSAFTAEYRFTHVSNAGLAEPNIGLNTSLVTIGHTWFR
jgi:hypothetical protein